MDTCRDPLFWNKLTRQRYDLLPISRSLLKRHVFHFQTNNIHLKPECFLIGSIQTNWSRHKNMYLCVLVINLICVKVCTRKCAHDYHNNGGSRWFMSGHTIVCLSGRRLVQYLLSAPLCGGDSAHHSSNGPTRREINNWGGKPPICGHREPQHLILNSGLNKDCRAVDYLSSTEWSGGKN